MVAVRVYIEPRDWWIGYYRGGEHHYICPLPCLVIRWRRRNPDPEVVVIMVEAPWTDEDVLNLNAYQQAGLTHPFTCPNDHDSESVLVAEVNGWTCPSCEYKQTWAHEFMFDPAFLAALRVSGGVL